MTILATAINITSYITSDKRRYGRFPGCASFFFNPIVSFRGVLLPASPLAAGHTGTHFRSRLLSCHWLFSKPLRINIPSMGNITSKIPQLYYYSLLYFRIIVNETHVSIVFQLYIYLYVFSCTFCSKSQQSAIFPNITAGFLSIYGILCFYWYYFPSSLSAHFLLILFSKDLEKKENMRYTVIKRD